MKWLHRGRRVWWWVKRTARRVRRVVARRWHAVRRGMVATRRYGRAHPRMRWAALASAALLPVGALGLWLSPIGDSRPTISATPYSPPPIPPPPPDPDTVFLDWGPSEGDLARALQTAQAMSLQEVAGQVIVARYSGTDEAGLRSLISTYHLGGVIFGGGNIVSRDQVASLAAAAHQAQADQGRDWPVIVVTDQEGGTVARLKGIIPPMPAFMASGAARDKAAVQQAFAGMGRDMAALGFTMDFAPVVDLTIGLADPTIRTRSPGSDPENASRTAIAAMDGLLDAGVLPAVKHFPGHGGVTVDSHISAPRTAVPVETLARTDLYPFHRTVDAGAPVVMIGHVVVEEWGSVPTSLNPEAYSYLRDEMGFTGVVVTDSLGMGAVNSYGHGGMLSVMALQAGADLVLMPADTVQAHQWIVAAVQNGTLSRERLDEAASRVIALMRYQASLDPAVDVEGDYVRTLGRSAATVVTPLCGVPLVGSDVTVSGGTSAQREALARALEAYGVRVGHGGTSIRLVSGMDGAGQADIVVALGGPWGLSRSRATTYIAMYGSDSSTLGALADILVNAVDADARWPVPIPGLPYDPCPSPR